ncbi:TatD family hydrolase [Xanthovirga aplysinae]|uniref:TatD family hydrolase n=1 Tax=Xanthovirga aplysinae TaxID=2529853 RepID=UPI0012BBE7C8|nr:TatD family hydrolase [Xanthovirga aplysinae]MTI32787.1 TatD family deoxyribonuclease [Xanthovirga aplysinae]
MEFVDTHAHIYAKEFKADIEAIINRSREEGVNKIFMPNIDHTSIDDMLEVENRFPDQCIAMMGLHPCHVKKDFQKELYIVEEWLSKRGFVAVGEIGIDLYWDKSTLELQQEAFKIQIEWAKKYNIPIVIHCRDAFEETMSIVEELKDDRLYGIFHCFTGSVSEAQRIIDSEFMIGIGGVATFKNAGMDKVIPGIDLKHIVLETDSPYLAPVPFRGKRNEPSYIPKIAQKVGDYHESAIDIIAEVTTANARKVFKY